MKLPTSPRARKFVALAAAILVCVLLNVRALNLLFIDDMFEGYAIPYMSNFAGKVPFHPKVRIILIKKDQQEGAAPWGEMHSKHREFFTALIKHMTAAKAKVVAFDMAFDERSLDHDTKFGEAVHNAKLAGVPVIVGADDYQDGKPVPEIPAEFNQPNWGLIYIGAYQGAEQDDKPIRALKLADTDGDNGVIPSLPLRIVMDSQSWVPQLEPEWNRLLLYSDPQKQQLVQTVPLDRGKYLFLEQASEQDLNTATVDAQRVYNDFNDASTLWKYENAIVIVGYEIGDNKRVQAGRSRLGVQLHATAVSNILRQVFVQRLYLIFSYLIIFAMALLALLMDTPLGQRLKYSVGFQIRGTNITIPIPIGLVIMGSIYLVIAIAVFKIWRIYLDVPYHLAALALSYTLLWLIFTFLAPKPPSSLTTLES